MSSLNSSHSSSLSAPLFSAVVEAPFGAVGIRTGGGTVLEVVYLPPRFDAQAPTDALAARAAKQVAQYLVQPDFVFNLPLAPVGTAFQSRVWRAISAIPLGEVLTYGQVAKLVQSAPRAVGQACGANWFPLIIPCHRVTASLAVAGLAG